MLLVGHAEWLCGQKINGGATNVYRKVGRADVPCILDAEDATLTPS